MTLTIVPQLAPAINAFLAKREESRRHIGAAISLGADEKLRGTPLRKGFYDEPTPSEIVFASINVDVFRTNGVQERPKARPTEGIWPVQHCRLSAHGAQNSTRRLRGRQVW